MSPGRRLIASAAWIAALLSPSGADAAQIVVMNIAATGDVPPTLAASLTPLMVAELSRHDGVSVVSQNELRALLEHEGNRQSLGCDDAACMTAIAGALGSELLLVSTLSRIGDEWVCGLTLVRPDEATVVRRATAKQRGETRAANRAVEQAVHDLFRDGLPSDLQGPASMTRRAYEAVALSFGELVLDPSRDPTPLRRRLILDLVNTELDYDTKPKMDLLQLAARRGISDIDRDVLGAKDAADRDRYLRARAQWVAVLQDTERVTEIREKARAQGMTPSSRPLRFLEPDPDAWPAEADIARYEAQWKRARTVVERMLRAVTDRSAKKFAEAWVDNKNTEHVFQSAVDDRERYHNGYEVVGLHAIVPWDLRDAIERMDRDNEVIVYLARRRDGALISERRVYVARQGDQWRVRAW